MLGKAVPFSYSPGLAPRNSRVFLEGTFRDIVIPAMTMPNMLSSRGSRKSDVSMRPGWTNLLHAFDVQVSVHRDKILVINPTRCTNFSNLFLE